MSKSCNVPLEELLPVIKHQADNPQTDSSSSEEDEAFTDNVDAAATTDNPVMGMAAGAGLIASDKRHPGSVAIFGTKVKEQEKVTSTTFDYSVFWLTSL